MGAPRICPWSPQGWRPRRPRVPTKGRISETRGDVGYLGPSETPGTPGTPGTETTFDVATSPPQVRKTSPPFPGKAQARLPRLGPQKAGPDSLINFVGTADLGCIRHRHAVISSQSHQNHTHLCSSGHQLSVVFPHLTSVCASLFSNNYSRTLL